jgi:hypothetical protein
LRYIKLFIAGLVIIYLLYRFLPLYYFIVTGKKIRAYVNREMIEESTISLSYVITEDGWLVFPFEFRGRLLRVVTNANLPRRIDLKGDRDWWYTLRYQITGGDGEVLIDRTHHLRSKVTFYRNERWGEFTSSFYTEPDLIPADSREFRINISSLGDADAIRFKLIKKDRDIRDVCIRVYIRYEPKKEVPGYMWRRFSEKKKERMAMGNVYPPQLLTEFEKKQLLQRQWRPLGPLGAEGRDFISRKLYVLKEVEAEEVDVYIPPIGVFIKEGHHVTVPVPEGGGRIRMEFHNNSTEQPHDLRLSWYGRGIDQYIERTIRWRSREETTMESFFDTGLIDIYSEDPVGMKVFLINDKGVTDITPEPIYIRTFITSHDRPVTFRISHHNKTPTPFKLTLRVLLRKGIVPDTHVRYEILNEDNRVIHTGSLPLNPIPSGYDVLSGNYPDVEVSEPQEYYFYLPSEARRMVLSSTTEVLVAGYTRPEGMAKTTRVPEDYLPSTPIEEKEPSWYALRPERYWSLIYDARSMIIIINRRPPQRREELIQGRYAWEDYTPVGDYQAYYVLTDEIKVVRPERLSPDYYFPLEPGAEHNITVREIKGLEMIPLRLLYIFREEGEAGLRVYIDGLPALDRTLYGRTGEVRLPPVKGGEHRIRIETTRAGGFYINNIYHQGGPVLFKRLTNRLKREGLRFIYTKDKPIEDILSVRFYAPSGSDQRSIIDVSIEAIRQAGFRPFNKWTFLRRRFSIRPDNSGSLSVLHARSIRLQPGQLFFIPIGDDLPQGQYTIEFRPVSGTGYISLHRVTPGEYEEFRFYNERALHYEDIY